MLDDTGERIIPKQMDASNRMLLEHLARYSFACPYASGKVLDIACGTGYGTHMVTKARKNYIHSSLGIDIDSQTVDYAKKQYYHPLLSFEQGDLLEPELSDRIGTFDTIISFETIEHVADDYFCLERLYQLLKPGGTLVLSTPFGRGRGFPSNESFHFHQLTEEEWAGLITDPKWKWQKAQLFYQLGVAIERPPREDVHYPLGIAVCKK
ncbi:bifunctional 2-polyprenyl-6-hydroxyphenol methylase/3-demethylubiquinol 3-O-methyltransferase UbiG [Sinobaca sp. H24]|uniref:class I SAM-dependent methyltransferase n=1 Tax=Sinobaca sp. H24 TaxID=2923376 RepID=UPI002079AC8F|nr:class I SAM-dependent methyltransferase [Sinobaca sp. H24]